MTVRYASVVPHPLGVVVRIEPGKIGELLIDGEEWRGHPFEELAKIALTTRKIRVEVRAVPRGP